MAQCDESRVESSETASHGPANMFQERGGRRNGVHGVEHRRACGAQQDADEQEHLSEPEQDVGEDVCCAANGGEYGHGVLI